MDPKEPDFLDEAVRDELCSKTFAEILRKRIAKILAPVATQTPLDTDDWYLVAELKFLPKIRKITCSACNGTGKRNQGWGLVVEERDDDKCERCHGYGVETYVPPDAKKPTVPKELHEALHATWKAYFEHKDANK